MPYIFNTTVVTLLPSLSNKILYFLLNKDIYFEEVEPF
jgi:hypothetical protein